MIPYTISIMPPRNRSWPETNRDLHNGYRHHHHVWSELSISLITRFMGPTWGPPGADRIQVGPMLAPWILLSGCFCFVYLFCVILESSVVVACAQLRHNLSFNFHVPTIRNFMRFAELTFPGAPLSFTGVDLDNDSARWTKLDPTTHLWPLLLTWFNFNPSMDK